MSGTLARVLTAAVLIPIVVAVVLWGPAELVAALCAIVLVLALVEFFALGTKVGMPGYRTWTVACSLGLVFCQWNGGLQGNLYLTRVMYPAGSLARFTVSPFEGSLLVFAVFLGGLALGIVIGGRPLAEALPAVGISAAGMLLVALPFSYLVAIQRIGPEGRIFLLLTLVLVWVGDTAAYFVGRAAGRIPFAPQLSPKKTWEGAIANLAGSMLVAWLFSRWITLLPVRELLVAAAVANIAGQIGDLMESAYKRSAGVKDSGTLLPGHGGVLDRIDALIFAAPAMWWYLWIITPRLSVLFGR